MDVNLLVATIPNAFTKHTGSGLGGIYYINEHLGFGFIGNFNWVAQTSKVFFQKGDAASAFGNCGAGGQGSASGQACFQGAMEMSDSMTTPWHFAVGIQYKPFYSKMNLASVLDFNYDIYINLMPGLFGTNQYVSKTGKIIRNYSLNTFTKSGVNPGVKIGLGFRAYINEKWNLNIGINNDLVFISDQKILNTPEFKKRNILKTDTGLGIRRLLNFVFGFGYVL